MSPNIFHSILNPKIHINRNRTTTINSTSNMVRQVTIYKKVIDLFFFVVEKTLTVNIYTKMSKLASN